jgi:hypothetical protein
MPKKESRTILSIQGYGFRVRELDTALTTSVSNALAAGSVMDKKILGKKPINSTKLANGKNAIPSEKVSFAKF